MSILRTEPEPAQVDGHDLKCLMCGHESFHKRKTHVDTALISAMNPEWSDSQCYCLVCDKCGFMHWFMKRPGA